MNIYGTMCCSYKDLMIWHLVLYTPHLANKALKVVKVSMVHVLAISKLILYEYLLKHRRLSMVEL